MVNTLKTIKVICKILITVLRLAVFMIVIALWFLDLLPKKSRSNCKIARALRAWALDQVKRALPRSVARYVR